MDIREFQELMHRTYGRVDAERGVPATIAWLTEELGELAQAVRKGTVEQQEHELGDLVAWTASLANQLDIDLSATLDRFTDGCPRCGHIPCDC